MSQQRIPISVEILADMETPLSVFKKLGNKPFSYLFESVEGGEKWARYSLIGLPSSTVIKVYKNEIQIYEDGQVLYYRLSAVDSAGNVSDFSETLSFEVVLSVNEENMIPDVFALHQNYPNPFNPVTTLRYDLPENDHVNITIYDMLGRQVKT